MPENSPSLPEKELDQRLPLTPSAEVTNSDQVSNQVVSPVFNIRNQSWIRPLYAILGIFVILLALLIIFGGAPDAYPPTLSNKITSYYLSGGLLILAAIYLFILSAVSGICLLLHDNMLTLITRKWNFRRDVQAIDLRSITRVTARAETLYYYFPGTVIDSYWLKLITPNGTLAVNLTMFTRKKCRILFYAILPSLTNPNIMFEGPLKELINGTMNNHGTEPIVQQMPKYWP